MAIKLKKQDVDSVTTPDEDSVQLFIATDGTVHVKDSGDNDVDLSTITVVELADTDTFSAVPGAVNLYGKDVDGNTELYAVFPNNIAQLTHAGALVGHNLITWDTTVGNPYAPNSTINAEFGRIYMVYTTSPDNVTINLPTITPDTVGLQVGVRLVVDFGEPAGKIVLQPDVNDGIEGYPAGDPQTVSCDALSSPHVLFESDGVDRWMWVGYSTTNGWYGMSDFPLTGG